MSPIAIVEEALTEGRALFSAAGELRDLFKRGRSDVEALTAESKETVDGLLSRLRAGLDAFKGDAARLGAEPTPPEAPPAAALGG